QQHGHVGAIGRGYLVCVAEGEQVSYIRAVEQDVCTALAVKRECERARKRGRAGRVVRAGGRRVMCEARDEFDERARFFVGDVRVEPFVCETCTRSEAMHGKQSSLACACDVLGYVRVEWLARGLNSERREGGARLFDR